MNKEIKWISLADAIARYRIDTGKLEALIREGEIKCKIVGNQEGQRYFIEDKKILSRISSDQPQRVTDGLKRVIEGVFVGAVGGVGAAKLLRLAEDEPRAENEPSEPQTFNSDYGLLVENLAHVLARRSDKNLIAYDNSIPIGDAFHSLVEVQGGSITDRSAIRVAIGSGLRTFGSYIVWQGGIDEELNATILFPPYAKFEPQDHVEVDTVTLVELFGRAYRLTSSLLRAEWTPPPGVFTDEQFLTLVLSRKIFVHREEYEKKIKNVSFRGE